jgi:hypothetical protein
MSRSPRPAVRGEPSLAMCIAISLFGIANSVFVWIHERPASSECCVRWARRQVRPGR